MKRIIAILMACLFALSFTIAFAQGEKKLGIVCTTFPQYDWVRQILGDRVNDVDLKVLNPMDFISDVIPFSRITDAFALIEQHLPSTKKIVIEF